MRLHYNKKVMVMVMVPVLVLVMIHTDTSLNSKHPRTRSESKGWMCSGCEVMMGKQFFAIMLNT